MTLLISQPPRIDIAEITTDQTGKLRAKITRPWSMYFEAMFARIGGNVASTPDDLEQGQLAQVQDYVVSLETSLSMISAESQRVAGEFDALLSQPAPSGLSLSLPAGQVPYGTGPGTPVASSANFTYVAGTNTLNVGKLTGSAGGSLTITAPTLAFYGSVPAGQPAAYTLTYSTAVRTVPAATAAAVVTTAATLVAYGYTQAQADSIPVAINAMQADMLELKKLIVSLINDLSTTSGVGLNAT